MRDRIPQLDAVRGIAILLVILHNESVKFPTLHLESLFANGWMGVDLFFVLSGFLITRILIDTKSSECYFKNFYARRCFRIWPLYFSIIILMFLVIPAVRPSLAASLFKRSSPWWAYPLFLQNILVPVPLNAAGPLSVTWSVAIEEQFYIVWAWVVRYCSQIQIRRIAVYVICLSPLLRLFLSFHHVNLYSNTFCRMDGLMAGALLAVQIRSDNLASSKRIREAWLVLLITLPLAFVTEAFNARWIVFSLSAAASAAFVYLALYSRGEWFQRVLKNPFLVFTGTISYGLYLLHKLPFDTTEETIALNQYPFLTAVILLVACYGLAALSWNLLEKPFLSLKRHFELNSNISFLTTEQIAVRGSSSN